MFPNRNQPLVPTGHDGCEVLVGGRCLALGDLGPFSAKIRVIRSLSRPGISGWQAFLQCCGDQHATQLRALIMWLSLAMGAGVVVVTTWDRVHAAQPLRTLGGLCSGEFYFSN